MIANNYPKMYNAMCPGLTDKVTDSQLPTDLHIAQNDILTVMLKVRGTHGR